MKLFIAVLTLVFSFSAFAKKAAPKASSTTPAVTAPAPVEAAPIAQGALGRWKSIDDETGKPKSIIEVSESNGELTGKVVQLFRTPEQDQNPKCDKCSGDKKDQQIIGMTILSGMKKDSDTKWVDGTILDPKSGKSYSCKIELIEDGKKLKVRGFMGISLLGRTQVWERP